MYNKNIVVIFIMCIVLIAIMGIIIFINIYPSKFNKIKIIENGINISGVSISVEENLITNTDIKIIIESENEFVYSTSSGDDYILYCWNDGKWSELQVLKGDWNSTEMMTSQPPAKKIEEAINWNNKYGKLENGRYRLERNIIINNIGGNYYIEFEIT